MTTKRSGLTLLEVIIASAVLAMVLLVTFQILFGSTNTATKASISGDLENRSRVFVDYCKLQFLTAKFAGPAPDVGGYLFLGIPNTTPATEMRYMIPVDRSADGTLTYGYSARLRDGDPAGAGKMCILRFEADTNFLESAGATPAPQPAAAWGATFSVPPALGGAAVVILNSDINLDGDRNDSFLRGKVMKYVVSALGALESTEELSDMVMIRYEAGTYYSSMTGTDRLFSWIPAAAADAISATGVLVNVWHGNYDQNRKNIITRTGSESIRFRNRQ